MSALTLPIQIDQPLNPYLGRLCRSFSFGDLTHQKLSDNGLLYLADIVMRDPLLVKVGFSHGVYTDIIATLNGLGTRLGALPSNSVLQQNFLDLKPPGKIPTKIREAFAAACHRKPSGLHSPSVLAVAIHPNLRLMADEAQAVNELLATLGLKRLMSLAQIFQHTP